jgi:hypothetical protein
MKAGLRKLKFHSMHPVFFFVGITVKILPSSSKWPQTNFREELRSEKK